MPQTSEHALAGPATGGSAASGDPIAEFYTQHPYPPPVDNLDRARDQWRDGTRRRAEYHLLWPDRPYRDDVSILVAGCGTWQAAKYALCHPAATVTGIDVSPTSVAHTEALRQQYDLANLEIRQLAIEQAASLERQFDLIVCTGVLHHLVDPAAGLRALRARLTPDGVIYLMVYAPYGRSGIYMLQEYCRRLGINAGGREIRDLMASLDALPPQHPLASLLRGSRDARDPDAMADALLNPRDRAYSVPQLFELLDLAGVAFSRWYWQAPYVPHCGTVAATPHGARIAALPHPDRDAAMELWRGTMTTHSVVVRRDGGTDRESSISFADERWRQFVPMRLPWTTLIVERVPAGAAGVLINKSHTFHDLVLVIDRDERQLVEAIDGRLNIAALVDRVPGVDGNRARQLFERLWLYDQVVFDTSRAPGATATGARRDEAPL